jgi:hypothetical protein
MNRRDFIQAAALVPAAIAGARLPAWAGAFEGRRSRVTTVVYDERYSDCRMFADALSREGAVAFATQGDCAKLWHGTLRAHLAQLGGLVAGLTTDSDFVVFRSCGRELSLSTIHEGAHDGRRSEQLTHRLRARDAAGQISADVLRSDAPWPESLAGALRRIQSSDWLRNRGDPAERTAVTPFYSADHPGYLTSWLLSAV